MSREGIEKLTLADIEAAAKSYMETFNAPPCKDLYDTPHSLGLCKWQNGKPVCVLIGAGEQYFDGMVFRVIELWTDNAYKRQGHARALMTELGRILKAENYKRIYLLTMKDTSTLGFYQSCGFETDDNMTVLDIAL